MALIDGIVSYWKMEETAGDMIDSVGSNDGTVTGATYERSGKIDDGYDFDGDDDYVTTSYVPALASTNFSVSMWIYLDTTNTDFDAFWNIKQTNTGNDGISLSNTKELNSLMLKVDGAAYSGVSWQVDGGELATGTWYHVVFTYDGTTMTVYVNGSEVNHVDDAPTSYGTATLQFGLFYKDYTTAREPDGCIDEIGLWEKELTSAEVTELYNSGSGLQYPFSTALNLNLNVGDDWKDVTKMEINIGDVWKEVSKIEVNVGDVWKEV